MNRNHRIIERTPATPAAAERSHTRARLRDYRVATGESGAVEAVCLVCQRRAMLVNERVEMVGGRAFFRCPTCGGSSLIHYQDSINLGLLDAIA